VLYQYNNTNVNIDQTLEVLRYKKQTIT
jgi:hypothetical protein